MTARRQGPRKSILITGASSGFGMGAAVELASRGWSVHAGLRRVSSRGRLDAALKEAGLPTDCVNIVPLDVTSSESIARAVDQVLDNESGVVDALLHNAGYTTAGFFEDLPDEECRRLMETIFFGCLALTRALLPTMRARHRGRIGVVTSNAVNVPHPLFSCYAAAKWALEGWAEALALEVQPFGVDVVVLQPGAHRTGFESNVSPICPADSPYRALFDAAMPRMARIGRHQRDPQKAVRSISDVLEAPRPPLRVRIGPDDKIAAGLKTVMPYRLRHRVVRSIMGFDRVTMADASA